MNELSDQVLSTFAQTLNLSLSQKGRKHNYLHILAALHEHPWAITPQALETMIAIVENRTDLEAVAAKYGRPLENTGGMVEMRGRTAILAVEGPIFRYANLFTSVSGATSVEGLAVSLNAAVENPLVSQIVLAIDSPGGEVNGINSLADQIRAASSVKPVIAYVDGVGGSAAYWLASAASSIVADESAFVGSLGVVATQVDRKGAQERQGVKHYEIVSSQSPHKRPDPGTSEGRAQLQEMVDTMADLFISRVAKFRGVGPDDVISRYGGGKVLGASQALKAGMVDKVQAFEPFLASLDPTAATVVQQAAPAAANLEEVHMESPNPTPAPAAQAALPAPPAQPAAAPATPAVLLRDDPGIIAKDRERSKGILALPEAKGREQLAQMLALETDNDVETARKILTAAPQGAAATPPKTTFEAEMGKLRNPAVGAGQGEGTAKDEAAGILAFVPKERRIA
jgi:signal peptide peptidase SppA